MSVMLKKNRFLSFVDFCVCLAYARFVKRLQIIRYGTDVLTLIRQCFLVNLVMQYCSNDYFYSSDKRLSS